MEKIIKLNYFLDDNRPSIIKSILSDSYDSQENEVAKYLPQSYIEEICNNIGNMFQKRLIKRFLVM